MNKIVDTKLLYTNAKGQTSKLPVRMEMNGSRIEFINSPFALKDEIKAMKGSRWHGFDSENPRKRWSIEDCFRNRFQLAFLQGQNVYEWFDRPLVRHEYERPLMPHQRDLADSGLTYHYQIWAAEMGVGKTLAAQEVIERSGTKEWFWVGPKSSIPNIQRELKKWKLDPSVNVEFFTYEGLKKLVYDWPAHRKPVKGVIFDESSRLKSATAERTKAAQKLADLIRQHYKFDGYVILMSGTPSPKRPTDWWSQCEIAWPGFLREGSEKALQARLGILISRQVNGQTVYSPIGWKDSGDKCAICAHPRQHANHDADFMVKGDYHAFKRCKNEVAYLHERLKGLVVVKHKKDCLSLPDKQYRKVHCKPNPSLLRVARTIVDSAPNAITGATLLRELSDGFQYREIEDGKTKCRHCEYGKVGEWYDPDDEGATYAQTDMLDKELVSRLQKRIVDCPKCKGTCKVPKLTRIAKEIPCPKVKALKELLDENDDIGRVVVFAGFTGSVDRCMAICQGEGWDVLRCDGRGMEVHTRDEQRLSQRDVDPLDYWADTEHNRRVAFVAHPESGGMSLTLTEARMAIFWSNSFKPEYRVQAEDRIHRKGMDENVGCTIVDLIHLPTDEQVLTVIRENRKLEKMTLGEIQEALAA